jgi:hypothetical protein
MAASATRIRRHHEEPEGQRVVAIVAQASDRMQVVAGPALQRAMQPMLTALEEVLRQAGDPAHAIVTTRALRALARTLASAESVALVSAGSAATDRDALIGLLLAEPDPIDAGEPDPLAQARLRGDLRRQALLAAEGGTLGVTQVATRLSLTRQAVDKRRQTGRLLAVPAGRHGYRYPAWQFVETGLMPGLESVLTALTEGEHAPWTQLIFFLGERADLAGRRPLDLLRAGEVEAVVTLVRRLGEHGAA